MQTWKILTAAPQAAWGQCQSLAAASAGARAPASEGTLTLWKDWWQNLPASPRRRQPGVSASKGTRCSATSCLAGAGLGQESGTQGEKSYLEKFNYLDSAQVGGRDRVGNRKREMAAKAPRISLLRVRNLTEQDSQWENRLCGAGRWRTGWERIEERNKAACKTGKEKRNISVSE